MCSAGAAHAAGAVQRCPCKPANSIRCRCHAYPATATAAAKAGDNSNTGCGSGCSPDARGGAVGAGPLLIPPSLPLHQLLHAVQGDLRQQESQSNSIVSACKADNLACTSRRCSWFRPVSRCTKEAACISASCAIHNSALETGRAQAGAKAACKHGTPALYKKSSHLAERALARFRAGQLGVPACHHRLPDGCVALPQLGIQHIIHARVLFEAGGVAVLQAAGLRGKGEAASAVWLQRHVRTGCPTGSCSCQL